jgi:hypothetical protein
MESGIKFFSILALRSWCLTNDFCDFLIFVLVLLPNLLAGAKLELITTASNAVQH